MKTSLPSISAPIYRDHLPSTNLEFTYRPFLVREEKLLQLIKDDDNVKNIYESIKQLIGNCTGLNVESLSVFDIEYIFLRLREKSVGETVELRMRHSDENEECDHIQDVEMDLRNIEIVRQPNHSTTIKVDAERDISLKMRYPGYQDILSLDESQDFDSILDILISCTEIILEGENVYDTKDFTKTELKDFFLQFNTKHVEIVRDFFSTMPKVCYNLEWTCSKCGKKETHLIEGVQNFLS